MEKSSQDEYKTMSYIGVKTQIKFLQGKILTIIDAVISDTKLKAVKDLINEKFREQLDWIAEISQGHDAKGFDYDVSSNKPKE